MNHLRFAAIGTILVFALTGFAGQSLGTAPEVEEHLKMLTGRLDLTSDQQARIKPVIAEMMETTQALEQDQSLSSEQRAQRITAAHQKADRRARKILNEDQKKKLDQMEQESYPERRGKSEAH
jgi:protein CpxP